VHEKGKNTKLFVRAKVEVKLALSLLPFTPLLRSLLHSTVAIFGCLLNGSCYGNEIW